MAKNFTEWLRELQTLKEKTEQPHVIVLGRTPDGKYVTLRLTEDGRLEVETELEAHKLPIQTSLYVIWKNEKEYDLIVNPQILYGYENGVLIEERIQGYSLINNSTKTYRKKFLYDDQGNLITETPWEEVL